MRIIIKSIRIILVGISFILIFLGAFFISLLAFPFMLTPLKTRTRKAVLKINSNGFRFFLYVGTKVKILKKIKVTGLENIPKEPALFIANHPCYLDILVILSHLPYVNCIIKDYLTKNILSGPMMRTAGYIPNNNAVKLIEDAEKSFQAGKSLIIFPEGTRTIGEDLNEFNRGAARIQLKSNPLVVPIIIKVTPDFMRKNSPWYQLPDCSVQICIQINQALEISDDLFSSNAEHIQARELTEYFRTYMQNCLLNQK